MREWVLNWTGISSRRLDVAILATGSKRVMSASCWGERRLCLRVVFVFISPRERSRDETSAKAHGEGDTKEYGGTKWVSLNGAVFPKNSGFGRITGESEPRFLE